MQKAESKKDWTLSPSAFNKFLAWLDEGVDSEGQKYLEMRQRLVSYFDRKNCLSPNALADETMNRVARRLEEEDKIETETPAKYCYIVARFVFMEYLRSAPKENVSIDEITLKQQHKTLVAAEQNEEIEIKEKNLNCLEKCVENLEPEHRQMIISYYFGEERVKIENRRNLAKNLGITINALSVRTCRLRDKLEACVRKCVENK